MDEPIAPAGLAAAEAGLVETGITAAGLSVRWEPRAWGAALRHFDVAATSSRLRPLLRVALPAPGEVVQVASDTLRGQCVLAWRSPTETWVLCDGPGPLAALTMALGNTPDACLVDQTGGWTVLRIGGSRAVDLLLRLGSTTAVPTPGRAVIGRLAELTVLSLCLADGERLLIVDRGYAEHLLGWIRATAGDF